MLDYLKLSQYCHNSITCKTEQYVHCHSISSTNLCSTLQIFPSCYPAYTHTHFCFQDSITILAQSPCSFSGKRGPRGRSRNVDDFLLPPAQWNNCLFPETCSHTVALPPHTVGFTTGKVSQERSSFPHFTLQKIKTATVYGDSDPYSLLKSLVTCTKPSAALQQLAFLHY